jgi:hypothetical protein
MEYQSVIQGDVQFLNQAALWAGQVGAGDDF